MKKTQQGFTLIELVVVIVLLGILGVTALGRFSDLTGNAESAAVQGIASEITAASAINYANSTIPGVTPAVEIDDAGGDLDSSAGDACDTAGAAGLFQSGNFPSGYELDAIAGDVCTAAGVNYDCTVYLDSNGNTTLDAGEANATATLICTDGS